MSNTEVILGQTDDDIKTDLAIERTELALERNHLAWMRTIIVLISSGFGIDQLVAALEAGKQTPNIQAQAHAHLAGLVLTLSGLALTLLTTVTYIRRRRHLAKQRTNGDIGLPPGIALSFLILIISLALIYLVIFQ